MLWSADNRDYSSLVTNVAIRLLNGTISCDTGNSQAVAGWNIFAWTWRQPLCRTKFRKLVFSSVSPNDDSASYNLTSTQVTLSKGT